MNKFWYFWIVTMIKFSVTPTLLNLRVRVTKTQFKSRVHWKNEGEQPEVDELTRNIGAFTDVSFKSYFIIDFIDINHILVLFLICYCPFFHVLSCSLSLSLALSFLYFLALRSSTFPIYHFIPSLLLYHLSWLLIVPNTWFGGI